MCEYIRNIFRDAEYAIINTLYIFFLFGGNQTELIRIPGLVGRNLSWAYKERVHVCGRLRCMHPNVSDGIATYLTNLELTKSDSPE